MDASTEKGRIEILIEKKCDGTSKKFAEEVGIQPGTISNILKDRNKPSLDVMQRILHHYLDVNPEWLILGKGEMERQKSDSQETGEGSNDYFAESFSTAQNAASGATYPKSTDSAMPHSQMQTAIPTVVVPETKQRKVKKITILFDDGTFQELG